MCPGNAASHLATLVLVPVLNIQDHNISSYQVSLSFVNYYIDKEFSGILQHENDVFTSHI